jgi:hypothetical protein
MWKLAAALLPLLAAIGGPAQAQQLLDTYIAQIGEGDHFNSNGVRLWSAAAIIRQDRANFHRFGIRDPADQPDTFFPDMGNRAKLERMIERGRSDPRALNAIVYGTPIIRVEIYGYGSVGEFVNVIVQ